jgi:hypothetical protein
VWTPANFNAGASAAICAVVAARYAPRAFPDGSPVIVGFELLNEPELNILTQELSFHRRAYTAIREAGMTAERVQVRSGVVLSPVP